MCMCSLLVPKETKRRGLDALGLELGSCELAGECWDQTLGHLEEQPTTLTP